MVSFDFTDVNRNIHYIKGNPIIVDEANYQGIKYLRNSNWNTTSAENFMPEWTAQYYTIKEGEKEI